MIDIAIAESFTFGGSEQILKALLDKYAGKDSLLIANKEFPIDSFACIPTSTIKTPFSLSSGFHSCLQQI